MKITDATSYYKDLRPGNICSERYRHLFLLLFWPVFGLLFLAVESGPLSARHYFPIHCSLDDLIPFCEFFVIPYLWWFLALAFMTVYTLLFDIAVFRRFMGFLIITYGITLLIYLIFPTCQQLRPEVFQRDNLLSRFMDGFYDFDTSTNVCPSLHVMGAMAVYFASRDIPRFRGIGWSSFFYLSTVSICLSTVFLKQHSIVDVFAALPIAFWAGSLLFSPSPHRSSAGAKAPI